MSENPLPGDIIQIKGKAKLFSILRQFSPNLKCISPFDIEDVCEAFATLLEIVDHTFVMNGRELKVFNMMLENGSDVTLPESAFDIVERGTIDDLGATMTIQSNFGDEITDRRRAEELMIHHMAAESIQVAFRRYRECKPAIKVKKVTSSQRLVENMAAETISKNLKKVVSKSKLSRGNSSRSLHSQQSTESLTTATVEPSLKTAASAATPAGIPPLHAPSTPQRPPQPSVIRPSPLHTTSASAAPPAVAATSGIAANAVSPIRSAVPNETVVTLPNGPGAVLHLTSMKASSLANACWQGVNDVYLVVGSIVYEANSPNNKIRRTWKYRTETLYEAGATADFLDQDLNIPIQTEAEIESDAVLQVEAYHQGLAIDDKLIGASLDLSLTKLLGVPTTAHLPEQAYGTPHSVVMELYEGSGAKRKGRGSVQLSFTLQRGVASSGLGVTVTSPTILPDAVSIASGSVGVLEFVKQLTSEKTLTKGGNKGSGGLSAASLNAARQTLNASEGKAPRKSSSSGRDRPVSAPSTANSSKREAQTKQSSDDSRPPPPQQQQQQRRTVSSETSTKYRAEDNNSRIPSTVVPLASGSYDEAGSYLTGPTLQSSNVSFTSEGVNSNPDQNSKRSGSGASALRLSVASQRSSNNNNTNRGTVSKPPEVQEAIPPTQSCLIPATDFRAVDEAFRLAFKQECAVVKVTVKELTLVLDALGYKVHPSEQHLSGGISGGGSNFSSIGGGLKYSGAHASYSIASASSAGSVSSRAVIDLPLLHATSLASTVSTVVRDRALLQYDSSVVSSGFEMSKHKAEVAMNHLSTLIEGPFTKIREYILFTCSGELGKNAIRESVGFNPSNNAAAAKTENKKYCRPSQWSEQQVGRLLSLLRIPQESFNGVDGTTLLSIDKQFLANSHDVRASLLRARFAVYQQLLVFLESWWDVGIRPEDFWNESSVKRKNSLKQQNDRAKSAGKKRPEVDIPALVAVNKDQVFEIAEFESLQHQMVSLNRAFGWGLGLDAMSLYSSGVERLRGKVLSAGGAADVKLNTRIAMKNNQDKISPKLAVTQVPTAASSAGQWIELGLRESDHAFSALMSLTADNKRTFDPVLRFSAQDQVWLAFVPNACLTPTKSSSGGGGGSKFPQTLQKDDIRLGMFVRITHSEALSRTCERFDWWDRPPPEILEQMAKCIGEVVSINELDSKQRVGIKILQSTVCDAVPIEALVGPCGPEEVQKLLDTGDDGEIGGKTEYPREKQNGGNRRASVKKSSSRRKSVAKAAATAAAPVKTPPRPPPAPSKEEVDPFAVAESKVRIQKMMKKLKKQYQDEAEVADKASVAIGSITVTVPATGAMSPQAKDLPPPHMVPNNWMDMPEMTHDEGERPLTNRSNEVSSEAAQAEAQSKLRHSAHNPWDGGSPIRTDLIADYSWLRPVPPVEKKPEIFKKTAVAVAASPLIVEDVLVDQPPVSPRNAQPLGVSAVHITQATFDSAHAQYRDGIHNGRAPPSPTAEGPVLAGFTVTPDRVHGAGMRGIRPKSATGVGNRKTGTIATSHEKDVLSSPKFGTDSAPFGVSGFGYSAKARAAQYVDDMTNKWASDAAAAEAAKSPGKKEGDKTHLERNKETLAKYFEFSSRANVDTKNIGVGGDHFLFSPPSPDPAPPQIRGKAEKIISSRPTSAPAAKNRGVSNRYTANLKLNQSMENAAAATEDEDMDRVKPRPLSEYIAEEGAAVVVDDPVAVGAANVTPERPRTGVNSKRKSKSPREDVLKHRENARSQKEADYKENSILRELKRLGVKNPW